MEVRLGGTRVASGSMPGRVKGPNTSAWSLELPSSVCTCVAVPVSVAVPSCACECGCAFLHLHGVAVALAVIDLQVLHDELVGVHIQVPCLGQGTTQWGKEDQQGKSR